MSLEQLLAENTAALAANTAILERVVAGQQAALDKLGAASNETKTTTRKAKDKPDPVVAAAEPEGNGKPAATESPAAVATTAAKAPTQYDLKKVAMDWRASTDDAAVRQKQGEFLTAMTQHFGAKMLTGPDGLTDPEQLAQAIFFVKRKAAGLDVDFGAEYDFDGDPAQGAAAEEYDPLG